MVFSRRIIPFLAIALNILIVAGYAYPAEDGFVSGGTIEGENFTIFYAPGVSIQKLNEQLGLAVASRLMAQGHSPEKMFSSEAELASNLDYIFNQACDILDMPLYSFHSNIKICRDYAQLNMIYRDFFKKNLGTRSFYVYGVNTIYTSADNFKLGIAAHEMAHVIISHYFPVLPSAKVQEVLAMYVEYQMRQNL